MEVTKDLVIREIQRVAKEKGGGILSRAEFFAASEVSAWHVYRLFDGWRDACKAAGVAAPEQNVKIDDGTRFEEMLRVFLETKGICTRMKFDKLSKYSVASLRKRYGKWEDILLAFREWLIKKRIDFPFIDQLPQVSELAAPSSVDGTGDAKVASRSKQQWQSIGGTTYGPILNFRGMQHAPINEQGVVFLFGMLAHELGFVVEAVRVQYPDCEAKRRLDKQGNKWERVRIEFEYLSSHFRDQGHKPQDCDVIVCWEHNWPECPLEVIELRLVLKTLDA